MRENITRNPSSNASTSDLFTVLTYFRIDMQVNAPKSEVKSSYSFSHSLSSFTFLLSTCQFESLLISYHLPHNFIIKPNIYLVTSLQRQI